MVGVGRDVWMNSLCSRAYIYYIYYVYNNNKYIFLQKKIINIYIYIYKYHYTKNISLSHIYSRTCYIEKPIMLLF